MTIATAYFQPLNADSGMASSDYGFAIPISPLTAGGDGFQIVLQGPASGSVVISDMWAGKLSSGIDFVSGTQAPVTVGGVATFTLSAGQELTTDPIMLAVVTGDVLLITHDAVGGSGKNYRRKNVSGLSYSYKPGQQNAANGAATRTGYTAVPNYTATVSGIIVGTAADFASLPPPPPPESDVTLDLHGIEMIRGGECFAAGVRVLGETDKYTTFMLVNPTGSGEDCFPEQIVITPHQDCIVSLASAPGGEAGMVLVPSICDLMFGSPASTSKLYRLNDTVINTAQHSLFELKGGWPFTIKSFGHALCGLAPGNGLALVIQTPGVGATLTAEWREKATA